MAKRHVFLGLGIAAGLVVVVLGALLFWPVRITGKIATAFDPHCNGDAACETWAAFRTNHPYPYQTFASSPLSGGRMLLVVSEPPPDVSRGDAIALFKALFADRAAHVTTRRWMTGADGYVEDVLVEFDAPDVKSADLLESPELRDRLSLLGLAWFGTSYGLEVEPILTQRLKRTAAIAPNLDVTAAELNAWLGDPALSWQPIEGEDPIAHWADLAAAGATGAYRSSDGALVLLTFPRSVLDASDGVSSLKAAFRRYAVASDATVGAVWKGDQVAFLGRGRTHALAEIPPLRFETFAQLTAQRADALHQSYERTNAMAGKLINADFVDWAPIYLSPALEDTELGSLLDITDQMLKSWSEAGQIDYLYFDYPLRPKHFPFDKPLSTEVHEKQGGNSVLFNWNTAGSAVVVQDGDQTLLTAHSLGALPITYGSDLKKDGPTQTGHLTAFEERAYTYFSQLGDPSLARVVQYTLMYQTFRALAGGGAARVAPRLEGPPTPGAAVLIKATEDVLHKLQANDLQPLDGVPKDVVDKDIAQARAKLEQINQHQPSLTLPRLAALIADPRRGDLTTAAADKALFDRAPALEAEQTRLRAEEQALKARGAALKTDIENSGATSKAEAEALFGARMADFQRDREAFKRRVSAFNQSAAPLEKRNSDQEEVQALSQLLGSIVPLTLDLRYVRDAFSRANARTPRGWIRTPSYVTSINKKNVGAVGGHNLDARALHLVPDRSVDDLAIVEGADGSRQLHYNPDRVDAPAHASLLAREVEHGAGDLTALRAIINKPAPPRTRAVALELDPTQAKRAWSARLGMQHFATPREFEDKLALIKAQTPCCRVMASDKDNVLYLAETNAKPPPLVRVQVFGDTASFGSYLRKHGGAGDLVALDQPPDHVRAMLTAADLDTASASRLKDFKIAIRRWFGGSGRFDHMLLTDLRGRRGSIALPRDGAVGEPGDRLLMLAKRRGQVAHVETLNADEAAGVVGGIDWNLARHGAPQVVRVRYVAAGADFDVVAGFKTGETAANQQLLQRTVDHAVAIAGSDGRVLPLMLTIKNDLEAMPTEQIGRVVLVAHDQGGARMQLSQTTTRDVRVARG